MADEGAITRTRKISWRNGRHLQAVLARVPVGDPDLGSV
jgi:hypothetical protein